MDARAAHDFFSSHGIDARRADPEVLNAAYRALAKKLHPDRGGSSEAMKDLNRAYDVLKAAINNGSSAGEQERQRQQSAERERQAREQATREQEARRQAEKERQARAERERAEKERREHAEREKAEKERKEQERAEREQRIAEQRQKAEREQAKQELAAKTRLQQDQTISEDALNAWAKRLSAGIAEARNKNDEKISWQTQSVGNPKGYDKTRLFLATVIILTTLPIVGVFLLAKEKSSSAAVPPSTPEIRWTNIETPSQVVAPATTKLRRLEDASEIECQLKDKRSNLLFYRLSRTGSLFLETSFAKNGAMEIHDISEEPVWFPSVSGEWLFLKYSGSRQDQAFYIVVPNLDLHSSAATVGASLTSKNDITSVGRELASGSCRATL
jgi:curved DNA-binding protein CbpA